MKKTLLTFSNLFIHLHLLLLELPDSFLEGFGRPKQDQGPGKSQADGADQASSLQTVAECIAATVPVVVAVAAVPFVELENAQ